MSQKYIVEIATSDFPTTKSAVEGGADRIELCANLAEGGTTPSVGHIRQCRNAFSIPIFPIVRPRGGDFLYSDEEFQIMLTDIQLIKEAGCDGVVIGMLNRDGSIDVSRTARLVEAAYPLSVTFHRAFDRCRDPFEALEQLISIGCERILTSGQQPTAPEGIPLIKQLHEQAAGRLIILPGCGVFPSNSRQIVEATGCTELHASLRSKVSSPMEFIHPSFEGSEESYSNNAVLAETVREMKAALQNI